MPCSNRPFISSPNLASSARALSRMPMYTSQVTLACLANPELEVVYPEEGVGFGIMAQFIPSQAPFPRRLGEACARLLFSAAAEPAHGS